MAQTAQQRCSIQDVCSGPCAVLYCGRRTGERQQGGISAGPQEEPLPEAHECAARRGKRGRRRSGCAARLAPEGVCASAGSGSGAPDRPLPRRWRGAVTGVGARAGVLERPGLDRSQPDGAPTTESGLGSSDTVRGKKLGGGAYR